MMKSCHSAGTSACRFIQAGEKTNERRHVLAKETVLARVARVLAFLLMADVFVAFAITALFFFERFITAHIFFFERVA